MSINTYRFGNKMIWRLVIFSGIIFTGLGYLNILVSYIVNLGIEWVSPNDMGLTFLGILIMFSGAIAEKLTDRLFKEYEGLELGTYDPEEEQEEEESDQSGD